MSLSGKLEDFSVVDTMQYIHMSRKSGILSVENGDKIAEVFYKSGEIIRVARPGLTNIGEILCEKGRITRESMDKAIRIQELSQENKPVGIILQEMGFATREDIKDALIHQITVVIDELIQWDTGDFSFTVKGLFHPDNIVIALSDLALPEELSTEFLLMEAIRKFDEARSPRIASPEKPSHSQNTNKIEIILLLSHDFDFDNLVKEIPDFPIASVSIEKPDSFGALERLVLDRKKEGRRRIVLCEILSGQECILCDSLIKGLSSRQKKNLAFIIIGDELRPTETISLYFHGAYFILPKSTKKHLETEHRFKALIKKVLMRSLSSNQQRSSNTESDEDFSMELFFGE